MAGGFWQQLPAVMARAWPFQQKACVEIECEDASRKHSAIKKERGLSTWEFQVLSSIRARSREQLSRPVAR